MTKQEKKLTIFIFKLKKALTKSTNQELEILKINLEKELERRNKNNE